MDKEQYEIMRRQEDGLWWYVGMRRVVASLLAAEGVVWRAGNNRGFQVLDAGCGTGATLDFLASRGQVFGVDIADEALRHCQERGFATICRGSVDSLPFRADTFDLVTCFDVVYHRAVADDVLALSELHRVLKPGGRVVVRVPAYDWLRGSHDAAVHTRHRYGGRELRDKLRAAGFEVARVTHANCLLLPLAIAKRVLESRGAVFTPDLSPPRPAVNRFLIGLLGLEGRLVCHANLPWGLSIIAIGSK